MTDVHEYEHYNRNGIKIMSTIKGSIIDHRDDPRTINERLTIQLVDIKPADGQPPVTTYIAV